MVRTTGRRALDSSCSRSSAAGFTGLPVSTTHIVTSGIGGTMVTAGAGLRYRMISRVVIAWLVTLPVTIVIAGGLYYLLASPNL
jgi:inorganic phosphate transporter, PiT family